MRISFDFDGTLTQEVIQRLCVIFARDGHEIWIVTARLDKIEWNNDLYKIADFLGIPKERIHFTGGSYKWEFLHINEFDLHFDDDYMEVKNARENQCACPIIHVLDGIYN